jgi:flagellar biogenesis protein FliO
MIESLSAVLLVVLLLAAAAFVLQRTGPRRAMGPVELLARLPLEARRSVYVIRVVDQILIIGSSEAGLSKLGDVPEAARGALQALPKASFASVLADALGRRGRDAAAPAPPPAAPRGES